MYSTYNCEVTPPGIITKSVFKFQIPQPFSLFQPQILFIASNIDWGYLNPICLATLVSVNYESFVHPIFFTDSYYNALALLLWAVFLLCQHFTISPHLQILSDIFSHLQIFSFTCINCYSPQFLGFAFSS